MALSIHARLADQYILLDAIEEDLRGCPDNMRDQYAEEYEGEMDHWEALLEEADSYGEADDYDDGDHWDAERLEWLDFDADC